MGSNQETRIPGKIKGNGFYLFVKRSFDIFASFLGIVLFSWLLLILALLVKFSSKGPVLFKDERIGKNGKVIKVLKYRSMFIDAETNIDKYLTSEQKEIWIKERKLDNDPRITKVGNFLRKTSLDELPQLFNIFVGDMSIVGPRPITERELNLHFTKEEQKVLLLARPGLFGNWAVNGRSNVDFKSGERQKLELEYYEKRSLWFDLCIIFKVFPTVFSRKGAN